MRTKTITNKPDQSGGADRAAMCCFFDTKSIAVKNRALERLVLKKTRYGKGCAKKGTPRG